MKTFKNIWLLVIVVLFVWSGCVQQPKPRPIKQPTEQELYLFHKVQFSGETLGLIASWYTGKSNLWQEILKSNPGLQVNKIELGSVIKIPRNLVVKEEPLPQKFVPRKSLPARVDNQKKENATSNSLSDQSPVKDESLNEGSPSAVSLDGQSEMGDGLAQHSGEDESANSVVAEGNQEVLVTSEKLNKSHEEAKNPGTVKDMADETSQEDGTEEVQVKSRYELLQEMLK